jgi:hypothetical protein
VEAVIGPLLAGIGQSWHIDSRIHPAAANRPCISACFVYNFSTY